MYDLLSHRGGAIMDRMKIYPTSMAQWVLLVKDAEKAGGLKLKEELENYLVILLQRFVSKPEIAASTLALEYLESQNKTGASKKDELRDVGDKCLLFSGLFPELAEHRHVSISYFVDLGQRAYCLLSHLDQTALAELFHLLDLNFVTLMDTLQYMRELAGQELGISPLQAEELWRSTGSKHALQVLRRYAKGISIMNNDKFDHLH